MPFYGDLLVARWAFEALAVEQFKNNSYEKGLYEYEKTMQTSLVKKDFWLKILDNKLSDIQNSRNDLSKSESVESDILTLKNELTAEIMNNGDVVADFDPSELSIENFDEKTFQNIKEYFAALRAYYILEYKTAASEKDAYVSQMQSTPEEKQAYINLKKRCYNESLTEFVTNKHGDGRSWNLKTVCTKKSTPYTATLSTLFWTRISTLRARGFSLFIWRLSG